MTSIEQSKQVRRYAAPRGTSDVLPDDWPYWRFVRDAAERVCGRFGYGRIDTPVFEHAGVYLRTAGEATDLVEKEMYLFEDRGGDLLALRPEGTAGVVRAYIEHGMANLPQPVRLFYVTPNFRYDRPQAGRYRQHTQAGVELFGEADPLADAEVIDLLRSLLHELGIRDVTLKLNSIGDPVCRPAYIEALRTYFGPHLSDVCDACRGRYEKNPLRLLDCKEDSCQPLIAAAPRLREHLCDACREHFEQLQSYLQGLGIDYEIDDRLVRGLDYYTRTVFEAHPHVEGAQSSIINGGRYDGLVELLGGPPTPAVGFGAGLERLIINIKRQGVEVPPAPPPDVYIAHMTSEAAVAAMKLADTLRAAGLQAMVGSGGRSLKAQMRQANVRRARFAAIIGQEEVASGEVTVRDLSARTEFRVSMDRLADALE